jgi:HEAT repeat protein
LKQDDWDRLVDALRDASDVERAVAAARTLQQGATAEDVPRLMRLLTDGDFFVREAAAWPISDLGVTEALPALLEALHRGFQEGHDGDGLSAALADLVEMNARQSHIVLKSLLASGPPHLREHALWLLEFCGKGA